MVTGHETIRDIWLTLSSLSVYDYVHNVWKFHAMLSNWLHMVNFLP